MKKLFSFISVVVLAAILGVSSASAKSVAKVTEVTNGAVLVDVAKDGIRLSPSGDTLYVAHRGADDVAVKAYNAATLELIADLPGFAFGNNYGGDVAVDDRNYVYGTRAIIAATAEVVVARWTSITDTPDTLVALLGSTYGIDGTYRAGYGFDVNIDKSGNGFIILPVPNNAAGAAGASFVYIPVANDVAGTPQQVALAKDYGKYPRVRIINDTEFWYDGASSAPVLVTMAVAEDGTVSVAKELVFPTMAEPVVNGQGNGVSDFVLGDKRYMVIGTNNHNSGAQFLKPNLEMLASVNVDETISAEWIAGLPIEGMGSATNSIGCTTSDVCVKDGLATIYVSAMANGLRKFTCEIVETVNVTLNVNDATMGTVTGGGELGKNTEATIIATPNLGHSFVCWMNGTDTVATTAEYTFKVEKDTAFTAHFQKENDVKLTLAVNDATMGSITLPEGIVMGENTVAYGTQVTLTAVPAEGATFNGWLNGEELYSSEYTIDLTVTADLALTAQFSKSLMLEYDLGGGVTNAYGWLSKAHMCLDLQNDYNTAYNASKAWAKEENGVVYYYVNGEWRLPEEVEGSAADVTGFLQNATYNTSDNLVKLLQTEKWAALGNYINGLRTAAGNAVADEGAMRADLSGFFLNSPAITDYRTTNDYAIAGQPETFCPVMQMGFDNPTEVIREVVLNNPYHPTLTFYGWYAAADFSGDKYTKVSPETVVPGGKLYAKFDEYIPSIAEVLAMEEGVETKVSGVVNWVRNNNVFIQDATGGFLLYGTDLAPEVGTKVIAKGKRGSFNGSPQLSGAVVESAEEADFYAPVLTDLATLVADSTALKHFGKRIQVLGVKVAEYDDHGNVYLTDGINKVKGHYMTPDQSVFKVGVKVDVIAVGSQYQGTFQFEGDVNGITLTVVGLKDSYNYPKRADKYTLENKWVISTVMDNFAANAPGGDQKVRGMVAKDGIMYFINQAGYIVRVDGATGTMLDPLTITGDHLFQAQDSTGAWSSAVTHGFNDIKFDQAGNCLITGLPTSVKQHFMVYEVDLNTGAATLIIDERLADNLDYADLAGGRFDALGVYGDVHGNACIMAADASGTFDVYRWLIYDGEVQPAEQISMLIDPEIDNSLLITKDTDGNKTLVAGWGTAPQIFPQDENGTLFYVDGFNTLPTLFDEGGFLVQDFIKCPHGTALWNNPGDTTKLHQGLNGIQEFQLGDEYFFVMIATHTPSSPPSAFGLYKFADEARSFDAIEPLWYFPNDGMGGASNGVRTAVPTVEVNGNKATIYLYAQNNGYAVYEFVNTDMPSDVENVEGLETVEIGAKKVIENGQVYIIKNGVKYNVLGSEIK